MESKLKSKVASLLIDFSLLSSPYFAKHINSYGNYKLNKNKLIKSMKLFAIVLVQLTYTALAGSFPSG